MSDHVSTPHIIAVGTYELYTCLLKASSNVNLEYVALLGKYCLFGRDSSLNLLVLVFVSVFESLSQVDVAFNVLDPSVIEIYWCVIFHHQFVFDSLVFRP